MKSLPLIYITTFVVSLLISCVPIRQFQDLEKQTNALTGEMDQVKSENELLSGRNTELQKQLEKLRSQVSAMAADTLRLGRDHRDCREKLARMREEYDQLLAQLRNQTGAGGSKELLTYLQTLQEELQAREDALRKAERDLAMRQQELDASQSQLSSQTLRLQELERALARKDSASNALRQAVANALTGFDKSQLNVHIKNGKVYVSLEEKLLFGSGSYQVGAQGASAIRKVAEVLAQNTDINVMVEGHTDPVPYRSGVLLDNWDLSVKRATSVVRILLENKNIDPSRIIAAGRGEFVPVTSNDTAAGRQKNRRTEIILTPELDKILNLLETR